MFAVVLLVAGCGGGLKPEVPSASSVAAKKQDTGSIKIEGDRSAPVNELAIAAIADLQTFWTEQFRSCTTRTTSPSRVVSTP